MISQANRMALINTHFFSKYSSTMGSVDQYMQMQDKLFTPLGSLIPQAMTDYVYQQPIEDVSL